MLLQSVAETLVKVNGIVMKLMLCMRTYMIRRDMILKDKFFSTTVIFSLLKYLSQFINYSKEFRRMS